MIRKLFVIGASLGALVAIFLPLGATAGGGTGITATPASTVVFDNDTQSATFVRSASDIITETNRVGLNGSPSNPWSPHDVWVQFRPTNNPYGNGVVPNPACESNTVVAPSTVSGGTPQLQIAGLAGTTTSGYFLPTVTYNVCVYYVHPFVLTLTGNGATSTTIPTTGTVLYAGTYSNGSVMISGATVGLTVFHGFGCASGTDFYNDPSYTTTGAGGVYSKMSGNPPGLGLFSAQTNVGSVKSNCVNITVEDYVLTLKADGTTNSMQNVGHHTIYTGTETYAGTAVSGDTVTFSVWNGTGCSGSPLYTGITGPDITDTSGNFSRDGGPDPLGVYSVTAYTTNATSNCVNVYVGQTTTLYDVTGTTSSWDCATGATGGTATGGSVYWYRDQTSGMVTATITGAAANTTYDLYLESDPGTCPPGTSSPFLTVTTDGSGNVAPCSFAGATGVNYWLSLWTPSGSFTGTQVLRTTAAAL